MWMEEEELMNDNDQEVLEMLRKESNEFRHLEEEHRTLDVRLSALENKNFQTPEDELEIKAVKKQKLIRKDRMAEMIREFEKTAIID
ncbi:MAG TPA: DUF465 domain-containing protein [Nitrospirae bacterium]|nr:DUF465 domain-containing protein [Nitrospirota bacterium]